ncbi:MAG: hypothetical protein ACWA40_05460 [Planktomarina sp.]
MTGADADDLGGFPSWYYEIFPAGPAKGFYQKWDMHSLVCVERSPKQLVITFDNLAEAGNKRYDREAWAGKFCRDNGWSHIGVFAQGPTWFRDDKLIAYFEYLAASGYFSQYDNVALAGASMGGFGAMIFASMIPGATVLAFSPQSTLAQNLVPWERRFGKGRAQDWTLDLSDAARTLDDAARTYVIYDPFLKNDVLHVNRLPPNKITVLKGPGLGHKSALVLRRMNVLKAVMSQGIAGDLTPGSFKSLIEGRKSIYLYRKNMEAHLNERGKPQMALQFRAAFQRRKREAARLAEQT